MRPVLRKSTNFFVVWQVYGFLVLISNILEHSMNCVLLMGVVTVVVQTNLKK